MYAVPLTGSKAGDYFFCSKCDAEFANSRTWYSDDRGYIRHSAEAFHLMILGLAPEGKEWDHIDRDRSNNTRENLRAVSRSQNDRNANRSSANTSGIKGVSWDKQTNRWRACIRIHRRQINLGRFISIEEARVARERAELLYKDVE